MRYSNAFPECVPLALLGVNSISLHYKKDPYVNEAKAALC